MYIIAAFNAVVNHYFYHIETHSPEWTLSPPPAVGSMFLNGAPEETRTPKIWLLRPTRIPIPSPGQNTYFKLLMNVTNCLVCVYYNIKTLSCQQLFIFFLHMIVSSANNLCNYYIVFSVQRQLLFAKFKILLLLFFSASHYKFCNIF